MNANGLPAGIDLPRHRDFEGRSWGLRLRRTVLLVLFAFLVAGLLDVFGQETSTSTARGALGSLTVTAPSQVRGGLLYQARFEIHASDPVGAPTLVLDRGWYDDTTINTVEPEPVGSTSDANHVKLRFEPLAPGRTLLVYMNFQANPTNIGSHDASVALYDGARRIASLPRTQTDFP